MNPKSSRRNNAAISGAKAIITSASVAATIGGWMLMADASQGQGLAPVPVQVVNAQSVSIGLPPLNIAVPTVVPAQDITVNGGQTVTQPAPQQQTQPQVTDPNAFGNQQPFPFTNTRSSR